FSLLPHDQPIPPLFPYTTLFRSRRGCASVDRVLSRERTDPDTPRREALACASQAAVGPSLEEPSRAERALCLRQVVPRNARVFGDRKSTRLNSSHVSISYAVFCL